MSDKPAGSPALMREWTPRFEYTHANVDNYAPDLGGVYSLIYKSVPIRSDHSPLSNVSDGNYYIFYVGQGNDLYKCLMEHLNLLNRELPKPVNPYNDPDGCIKRILEDYKCYFRFILISSEKKRNRIKTELENSYIPKGEMEFAAWADNFIRVLSANAAKWFIPPDATAKLQSSHKEYMASYDAHLRAKITRRAEKKKLKDAQQEGEEWKGGD